MPDKSYLLQMKALPLNAKVHMSQARIREWYDHFEGNVCISFSGGKDSTVLAHIVREFYPDVPMVFANTGLEFPEIQAFAKKMGALFVRPKMRFDEVISTYGYPIISKENAEAIYRARKIKKENDPHARKREPKREDKMWVNWRRKALSGTGAFSSAKRSMYDKSKWLPLCRDTQFQISHVCCQVMKKDPMKIYQKQTKAYPYIGTLTEESKLREQAWIKHGCNAFDATYKSSQPMSFWTEQDVLKYIYENSLEIASVYGDIVAVDDEGMEYDPCLSDGCNLKCTGCQRTGCIFCGFGVHLEKGETRFQRLAKTHPKQYEYCIQGGQWVDNPNYDPAAPRYDEDWENWNPKKIWVPSKKGLGMKKVFDDCNQIYGKDFIRYE